MRLVVHYFRRTISLGHQGNLMVASNYVLLCNEVSFLASRNADQKHSNVSLLDPDILYRSRTSDSRVLRYQGGIFHVIVGGQPMNLNIQFLLQEPYCPTNRLQLRRYSLGDRSRSLIPVHGGIAYAQDLVGGLHYVASIGFSLSIG